VKLLKNGNVVNAVGLTNPGVHHWMDNGYKIAKAKGYKVAASVAVEKIEEASDLGELLADLSLAYIEFNASCPNTGEVYTNDQLIDAVNRLHGESGHPIVVKISYDQSCDYDLIKKLDRSYAQAIHCINTVPWSQLYRDKPSPLAHLGGGGVSGPDIFQKVEEAILRVKRIAPELPIIAGGGITSIFDILTLRVLGAAAFSIGTLFLRKPWAPNLLVKEYDKEVGLRA
jgi:dihydroorotate dehydrogenase (NAD+) catalytic subunit